MKRKKNDYQHFFIIIYLFIFISRSVGPSVGAAVAPFRIVFYEFIVSYGRQ